MLDDYLKVGPIWHLKCFIFVKVMMKKLTIIKTFDLESEFYDIPPSRKIYFKILVYSNDSWLFPSIIFTFAGKNLLLHYFVLKAELQEPKIYNFTVTMPKSVLYKGMIIEIVLPASEMTDLMKSVTIVISFRMLLILLVLLHYIHTLYFSIVSLSIYHIFKKSMR